MSEEVHKTDAASEEAIDDVDLEVQRLLSVYDLVKDEERLAPFLYPEGREGGWDTLEILRWIAMCVLVLKKLKWFSSFPEKMEYYYSLSIVAKMTKKIPLPLLNFAVL